MSSKTLFHSYFTTALTIHNLRALRFGILAILFPFLSIHAQEITGLEVVKTIEHNNYAVNSLDTYFDSTHQLIAYSNVSSTPFGDTLVVYDFLHDEILAEIPGTNLHYDIRFIHENQILYRNNTTVYKVDHFTLPEVTTLLQFDIYAFTVSADKSSIAVLHNNSDIWQVETFDYDSITGALTLLGAFMIPDTINAGGYLDLHFSPDGEYLALNAGYENDYAFIINTLTGVVTQLYTPLNGGTFSNAFYQQNGVLRLAVGGGYTNGGIEVFDVTSLSHIASIQASPHYNYSIDFDTTQGYAVSGGYDGILKLYHVEDAVFTEIASPALGFMENIQFTQDNQYLVSAHGVSGSAKVVIQRVLREPSGTSGIEPLQLQLYPNPAQNLLHLNGSDHSLIRITDIHNRIVVQRQYDGSPIDISALAAGFYTITSTYLNRRALGTFVKY